MRVGSPSRLQRLGLGGALLTLPACRTSPAVPPALATRPVVQRVAPAARPAEPPPLDPARACGGEGEGAGPVPVRRLTRDQYVYTVSDLLTDARGGAAREANDFRGRSVTSMSSLPSDEKVGPFRSNVVAAPTALDVQQLMEAAEKVAARAAKDPEPFLACEVVTEGAEACGARFVARFGARAFRRPLRPDEEERYTRLFVAETKRVDPAAGLQAVVRALLQSPYFLMHTREDALGAAPDAAVVPLGPYALASRLSYFLWDSLPDDALLEAAARGELQTVEGLAAQARRLLGDEKARRGILSFHLQWLGVEDVGSAEKNGRQFPLWQMTLAGAKLGNALRTETERFVDHVIRRGDGRLDTLLTASFSFLDDPLFEYYGVAKPVNHDPDRPVALDPRQRAGLLTQGSVLATYAHATQSAPVTRGLLVRRSFLCQELPDPPPDVNTTPPDPKGTLTTRERFEDHRLSGVCSRCHKLIDPVGFGFESYDAVGQFRTMDNGKPVDASGTIRGAGDLDGDFDGAVALARRLAGSPQVRACYVKQWFRYALGRRETEADRCTLAALEDRFERSGHDVRALLLALPTTEAFRFRRRTPREPARAEPAPSLTATPSAPR